jgi:diacylglycerol kinase family enzyme
MGHTVAMSRPIAVIINPNAGRHRPAADARRLAAILGWHGRVFETESEHAVGPAVDEALSAGAQVIAISGGDGTLGGVLNALLRRLGPDQLPLLTPTNSGTIDFVARKVQIEGDVEDIVARLAASFRAGLRPERVDVDSLRLDGCIRQPGKPETALSQVGFALAAGGIGQRFFSKYYEEPVLGARAIVRVVAQAVGSYALDRANAPVPERYRAYGRAVFRPTLARVSIDGEAVPGDAHGAIHAGAFDVSLGGVFRVFPFAADKGALHFQAGAIVPAEMIRALPALVRGSKIPSERLVEKMGHEMRVTPSSDELLSLILDGEPIHHVAELRVIPGPPVGIVRV